MIKTVWRGGLLTGFVILAAALWWIAAGQQVAVPETEASVEENVAEVVTAEVTVRHMPETAEFTGYLQAVEYVEVRPRISGHIDSVHFIEGSRVEAGQLLFQIDARPYAVIVDRVRAELAQVRDRQAFAEAEYKRARQLVEQQVVTRSHYDELARNQRDLAGALRASEAALRAAELDLAYTRITAPIAGRISRAVVTPGNLVNGNSSAATLLTTLVSIDPVHLLFDVDEQTYLRALSTRFRDMPFEATTSLGVTVQFMGEAAFSHPGWVDFIDNQVNPNTGTVRVRALLPNPEGRLTPGLFARLRLELGKPRDTLLIDELAIGADQGQRFVLALNSGNIIEYRPVRLGPRIEGLREIRSGLSAGDRVVVGALHRVRPGQSVVPVSVDDNTGTLREVR
jgi:RND family efflux transporter MFP subunit